LGGGGEEGTTTHSSPGDNPKAGVFFQKLGKRSNWRGREELIKREGRRTREGVGANPRTIRREKIER